MKELIRTKVNEFEIKDAITLEELEQQEVSKYIVSIEQLFEHAEKIELDDKRYSLFLNGVMLTYHLKEGVYRIYYQKQFIGLGIVKNGSLKRDVVV